MDDRLEVWIDGDCEICRLSRDWHARRDRSRRLVFRELAHPGEAEPPGSKDEMLREIHVRRADGAVLTGFDAAVAVLAALPRWRWAAAILRRPPCSWLGPRVYAFIARWRHRISRRLAG